MLCMADGNFGSGKLHCPFPTVENEVPALRFVLTVSLSVQTRQEVVLSPHRQQLARQAIDKSECSLSDEVVFCDDLTPQARTGVEDQPSSQLCGAFTLYLHPSAVL